MRAGCHRQGINVLERVWGLCSRLGGPGVDEVSRRSWGQLCGVGSLQGIEKLSRRLLGVLLGQCGRLEGVTGVGGNVEHC